MEFTGKEKMSRTNWIAMILLIILIIILGFMLVIDGQHSRKLSQELEEAAKQQYLEKKAFLETVKDEYDADLEIVSRYLPGIVCWGDSLTAGSGGNGVTYPKVLQALIDENICKPYDLSTAFDSKYAYLVEPEDYTVGIPVVNMGVGGEGTLAIAGRNGAIPVVVSEALTIPADTTPVEIHYTSEGGQKISLLRQGSAGVNPVIIDGIEGTLSIVQESRESKEYSYYFTRSVSGEGKQIEPGTEIVTAASSQYLDYVTVVFMGQNGGYADIEDLIRQQRAMIDHQDRFIIVGLHTGTRESRRELEEAMQEEYGDHYINLREYMATEAMADAGLEPTDEDSALMELGATPYSLMVEDHLHFNAAGYTLVGNLIFETMNELGYFEEVQQALTTNGN